MRHFYPHVRNINVFDFFNARPTITDFCCELRHLILTKNGFKQLSATIISFEVFVLKKRTELFYNIAFFDLSSKKFMKANIISFRIADHSRTPVVTFKLLIFSLYLGDGFGSSPISSSSCSSMFLLLLDFTIFSS